MWGYCMQISYLGYCMQINLHIQLHFHVSEKLIHLIQLTWRGCLMVLIAAHARLSEYVRNSLRNFHEETIFNWLTELGACFSLSSRP